MGLRAGEKDDEAAQQRDGVLQRRGDSADGRAGGI